MTFKEAEKQWLRYIQLLEETSRLYKRASASWDNVAQLAYQSRDCLIEYMNCLEKIKITNKLLDNQIKKD